jgi:glycosyltransferase involved in cell wall biosynthesis
MSALSVVVPVYGNAATLAELYRRVSSAAGDRDLQLILVDDASTDDSRRVITELAERDTAVEPLLLERNVGQHAAVLEGMRRARGQWTVVMDADLQDPPEAIPDLLAHAGPGVDVVFAGRRGAYEGPGRLASSRLFKRILARLAGVPRDAGMFFAASHDAVEALLELDGPPPFVVAMVGTAGLRTASVPVQRIRNAAGRSSYTSALRLRSAARGLRWALARRRVSERSPT